MPEDVWIPKHQPGWPDVLPMGLAVLRSLVRGESPDEEPDEDDLAAPDEVRYLIHGTRLGEGSAPFGLIADLTVHDPFAFAGVTVIMPLRLREELEGGVTRELADELVLQYAEWAAPVMYDFAAAAMRTMLAGSAMVLDVPVWTPMPEVHTSESPTEDPHGSS